LSDDKEKHSQSLSNSQQFFFSSKVFIKQDKHKQRKGIIF